MSCATIDFKVLASVSKFAYQSRDRAYLRGVHLEIDKESTLYVATDGHRLIAWRCAHAGKKSNSLVGNYTVPLDQCVIWKDGVGTIAKTDDGRLAFARDDVSIAFAPLVRNDKQVFVDWRRVVPNEPLSLVAGQYNGQYLASFREFSEAMAGDCSGEVLLQNGPADPAIVRFVSHDDAIGVVMPMRLPLLDGPLPEWCRHKQVAEVG